MTTTPPGAESAYDPPPPSSPPPGAAGGNNASRTQAGGDGRGRSEGGRDTFDRLRSFDLRRTPDGWIGGVCAGIAHRVGLDPLVIRAGFVVLGFFFGLGFFVYFLAWALIPDASETAHLERGLRNGSVVSLAVIGAAGIFAIGVLGLWGNGGESFASSILGLLVVGALGYGLYRAWSNRTTPGLVADRGYQGAYAAPPPPPEFVAEPPPPTSPRSMGPRPMGPRRGRRLSGGTALGALATGVVLIIVGLLIWGGNPVAVAWAVALAALGLALAVLGIVGRRAGFVGFLAFVTAWAAASAAVLPANLNWESSAGDVLAAPRTADEIEDVTLGVGQIHVDLANLEVNGAEPEPMMVDLTVGEVVIVVPSDLTVVVNSSVGAGEFIVDDFTSGQGQESGPTARIETDNGRSSIRPERGVISDGGIDVATRAVIGEGRPDVEIDVEVGLGQVRVMTQKEN